ncbi:MAG: aminotransferase class III-fold pyridoxal phosphate-dependent enzyme [Gammaproteobacteria bacterium]
MVATVPATNEDERLPLLVGFQKISETTNRNTHFIDHGRGVFVYDTDGNEYIEATSSFYVASLGYGNDELIDAIEKQYRDLPFYVCGLHRTPKVALDLAEKLTALVPVDQSHILFASTGSEAIDFLIKMLRFGAVANGAPKRTTIIGRHGSYHGGTLASASLTGGHHEEFALPIEGFRHVSQPDYHGDRAPGESPTEYVGRLTKELETLIEQEPDNTIAAFFAEPISFSAGFKIPPAEYFPALENILNQHGIDLVVDEVVTGMGRTGSFFGSQTLNLNPTHMTMAKGITSGYFPVSAVALGEELYDALERGSEKFGTLAHASTCAAHPVGAAAALKMLEIIERDKLVERASRTGAYLADKLSQFVDHPLVGDVRSLGLAGSLDFLRRSDADAPLNDDADEIAMAVYEALLARGVIVRPAGRNIVIAPPLIITNEEVDLICERINLALNDVLQHKDK